MNIIGWLLVAYFGLFASFGSASAETQELPAPSATEAPPSATEPPPAPLASPSTAAPSGERQIEERFVTRLPLPTCGMVTEQVEPGQAPPDTVWGCLQHAVDSGEGAELIQVAMTPEGDPVYTYYRVDRAGRLEMYTDLREDPDASVDWRYRQCRPSADLRVAPCQGDS